MLRRRLRRRQVRGSASSGTFALNFAPYYALVVIIPTLPQAGLA